MIYWSLNRTDLLIKVDIRYALCGTHIAADGLCPGRILTEGSLERGSCLVQRSSVVVECSQQMESGAVLLDRQGSVHVCVWSVCACRGVCVGGGGQ